MTGAIPSGGDLPAGARDARAYQGRLRQRAWVFLGLAVPRPPAAATPDFQYGQGARSRIPQTDR